MNELTTLLEKLAVELGTTAEYLWSVMIQQAAIHATIGIASTIVSFLLLIPVIKYGKYITKNWQNIYDNDKEAEYLTSLILFGLIFGIWAIVNLCMIGDTITAFANPEYWALEQILSKF